MILAETEAIYNRQAKEWQTITSDGAVAAAFHTGPKGKRAARLEALRLDRPDIHHQIIEFLKAQETHPENLEITKRAINAGYLIRDGHLQPPRALSQPGSYVNEVATVRSQSEPGQTWAICQHGGLWCSCPDFANGDYRAKFHRNRDYSPGAPTMANGQTICKHILAYLFNWLANIPF